MEKRILSTCLALLLLSCCPFAESLSGLKVHYVSLDDSTRIAYKESGRGTVSLVFVHGFGCDMNAWEEQFAYFQDKAQLIFLDLPGHGLSDKPKTEYTLDYYAKAVSAVMQQTQVQQAVLIGHSLGTAVCRQIALNDPPLAAKLVDVDGVYCFFPEDSLQRAENERQYAQFAEWFQTDDIKQTMENFIMPLFCSNTPENVKQYALSTMTGIPSYVALSTMQNLIKPCYWTGERISIPTLVFASVNSQIPADYRLIMQALYPQMRYHELDNIGHFIMMEQPTMFNTALEKFAL